MTTLIKRETTHQAEDHQFVVCGLLVHVYLSKNLDPNKKVGLVGIAHPRTLDYHYGEIMACELVHEVDQLACVTLDLPNHGKRMVNPVSNEDWKRSNFTHAQDMASILDMAAAEIESVLEYLPSYIPELEQANHNNTLIKLVTGASLGGEISWRIAVGPLGPFGTNVIKGIAPIVGATDIKTMLEDRIARQKPFVPESSHPDMRIPPIVKKRLEAYDKCAQLHQFPDFHILAMCGKDDQTVPSCYTERWFQSVPKENTRQQLFLEDGIAHWLSPKMLQLLIEWVRDIVA